MARTPIPADPEEVRGVLENNRLPVLSYELEAIRLLAKETNGRQLELGKEYCSVASTSDAELGDGGYLVPAATSLQDDSIALEVSAKGYKQYLEYGVEFLPWNSEETVGLGSICQLKFSDGGLDTGLLKGTELELPYPDEWSVPNGCKIITVDSALGRALLGVRKNASVKYCAAGQKFVVEVLDIRPLCAA